MEILVNVAIIAILAVVVIGLHSKVEYQANERLLEKTFLTLNGALEEFRSYEYRYADVDYKKFIFPVDCNGFDEVELRGALADVLELNIGDVVIDPAGLHDSNDSGCAAMYWFLNQVPTCRESLEKLDKRFVTNLSSDGQNRKITVDGISYPLTRVIDTWGQTLIYDYYDEEAATIGDKEYSRRNFPVITSAGPDKQFGTTDDISSR